MNFKFLAGLEDKSLGLVYREDYMFIVTASSLQNFDDNNYDIGSV